ncbi:15385_t:CDS:2 [Gigaspora margarita]|uniref:15385_t:CDS:1 n=1 Tax=Gigaspora margarita TaxID=4874 RepID=A0ABN7UIW3_GIGMA|nr:15385_t:CDS:2 [Gigaspora margarita]
MDEDETEMMFVERINKGVESIGRNENELNKDLETAKLEVGDISEDKGKDANVAETADESVKMFWDLTDEMDKSNSLEFAVLVEYLNDTPYKGIIKRVALTI